jgi:hypothetical protein
VHKLLAVVLRARYYKGAINLKYKEGKHMARGNFGNPEQHRKAGSMSSGNKGNSEQHSKAGQAGAAAQPTEAKRRGGERGGQNSHKDD